MLVIKKILDIVVSLTAILLLFPILLIVPILIKFNSSGNILYIQQRVGINRKLFNMYKFRSMYIDDNNFNGQIIDALNLKESRKIYKTTTINDKRVTGVGFYLRKYHIDELPQLFNIFLGDMSLIGPRPDVPAQEFDYHSFHWNKRHTVKPGITGYAQIHKGVINNKTRVSLDILYVKNISLCLDVNILFKTFVKILKGNSF
jgi:lipopolysaccharide/colanic/teichoic acid biosynthesis glycosyltransferase